MIVSVRNMTEPKQINKKLCIIGDGHTGKTCVLFRFKENKFIPSYEPTIFDNESKICEYRGQKVRLRFVCQYAMSSLTPSR